MTEMKNHKLTPTKTTNTATKMPPNSQLVRTETRDTKKKNNENLFISQKELTCSRGDGSMHKVKWGRSSRAIYIGERRRQMVIYHAGGKTKVKNPQWEVNDG